MFRVLSTRSAPCSASLCCGAHGAHRARGGTQTSERPDPTAYMGSCKVSVIHTRRFVCSRVLPSAERVRARRGPFRCVSAAAPLVTSILGASHPLTDRTVSRPTPQIGGFAPMAATDEMAALGLTLHPLVVINIWILVWGLGGLAQLSTASQYASDGDARLFGVASFVRSISQACAVTGTPPRPVGDRGD
jgi:hypothetical protein